MFDDSILKGQSAIEYLMTYGWMLLVVAVVGGAVFSLVGDQSVESVSGFTGADVSVENFGVTGEDELELVLRNGAAETVEVRNVTVSHEGESVTNPDGLSISVGESDTLKVENVSSSDSANSLDVKILYDIEGLKDMEVSGSISGPVEVTNGTQASDSGSTVEVSGDSITSMATSSTFMNSSKVICVGSECGETSGSETGEYVERSGDEMTGTLFTDNITDMGTVCFGELCSYETGSATGLLGEDGNDLDGSLNVTEIKPDSADQVCVGTKC